MNEEIRELVDMMRMGQEPQAEGATAK